MEAAEHFYQNGDYEMYIALMAELERYENPDDLARTYMLVADAYDKMGDYETAITYYLKAFEADPATQHSANQLCWDYGLLGKADLALPYCEQAVEDNPSLSTRDSRGLAYALLGKYDLAMADFQSVVDELKTSTKPDEQKIFQTRLTWLKTLQTGENPITLQVLGRLRKDATSGIALPTLTADEKKAVVTGQEIKKAAQLQGFSQFETISETPLVSTIGFFIDGSCSAALIWMDLNERPFNYMLMVGNCSDAKQKGLATWLIDLVFKDKSDKAKAMVWSLNDLYYVIEGEKTETGTEIIGGKKLSAEFDADKAFLDVIITEDLAESFGSATNDIKTWVRSIDWSADGSSIVAGSASHCVSIWEAGTGTQTANIPNFPGFVRSVGISPDGEILATGNDGAGIELWNYRTYERYYNHSMGAALGYLAWKPDGTQLAFTGEDYEILIMDLGTFQTVTSLKGKHTGAITGISWSPDGSQLASSSADSTVVIWDVAAAKPIFQLARSQWMGKRS